MSFEEGGKSLNIEFYLKYNNKISNKRKHLSAIKSIIENIAILICLERGIISTLLRLKDIFYIGEIYSLLVLNLLFAKLSSSLFHYQ